MPKALREGHGVYVLDMSDPSHPVKTANLTTPAMLSPHESLSLNAPRGILVAVAGVSLNPGVLDVYDVTKDCRHPRLMSSSPFGIVGHEGNFSPDGRTFWATSGGVLGSPTLSAVDLTDPAHPRLVWFSADYGFHGFSLSDDGNRLYAADFTIGQLGAGGLRILDVSQVQARVRSPVVTEVSSLSWDTWSLPQMTIPIVIDGHPYLIEIDEFARGNRNGDPEAPIGAARIISIADESHPVVVSDIRLEVHQPENVAAIAGDPGASWQFGGYSGHFCAVPRRSDPGVLACSFILSGLRVFDIQDPFSPKEIAYFNAPMPPSNPVEAAGNPHLPLNGAYAMSGPSFVPERREIWYSDGTFGFFTVRITNEAYPVSSSVADFSAGAARPSTEVQLELGGRDGPCRRPLPNRSNSKVHASVKSRFR